MRQRDYNDENRAEAPLRAAADAVRIDTTGNTLEESVAILEKLVGIPSAERAYYHVVRTVLAVVFQTAGMAPVPIQNHRPGEYPDTPGQPPLVLCCNHISVIDPVFLEMCQKRHVYFMAKEEIFKNRLATWFFAKQLGAFPVKRGRGIPGHWIPPAGSLRREALGIFPEVPFEGRPAGAGQIGRRADCGADRRLGPARRDRHQKPEAPPFPSHPDRVWPSSISGGAAPGQS